MLRGLVSDNAITFLFQLKIIQMKIQLKKNKCLSYDDDVLLKRAITCVTVD